MHCHIVISWQYKPETHMLRQIPILVRTHNRLVFYLWPQNQQQNAKLKTSQKRLERERRSESTAETRTGRVGGCVPDSSSLPLSPVEVWALAAGLELLYHSGFLTSFALACFLHPAHLLCRQLKTLCNCDWITAPNDGIHLTCFASSGAILSLALVPF